MPIGYFGAVPNVVGLREYLVEERCLEFWVRDSRKVERRAEKSWSCGDARWRYIKALAATAPRKDFTKFISRRIAAHTKGM